MISLSWVFRLFLVWQPQMGTQDIQDKKSLNHAVTIELDSAWTPQYLSRLSLVSEYTFSEKINVDEHTKPTSLYLRKIARGLNRYQSQILRRSRFKIRQQ